MSASRKYGVCVRLSLHSSFSDFIALCTYSCNCTYVLLQVPKFLWYSLSSVQSNFVIFHSVHAVTSVLSLIRELSRKDIKRVKLFFKGCKTPTDCWVQLLIKGAVCQYCFDVKPFNSTTCFITKREVKCHDYVHQNGRPWTAVYNNVRSLA